MKSKLLSLVIASLITAILFSQFGLLRREQITALEKANRLAASQELSIITSNMQTVLNLSMQYAEFFEVLIANNPETPEETITIYAASIIENNPMVHNVSIAPDGIVEYIYPIEGNEAAIGHNLFEDPNRASYLYKAMETRQSVSQGPVEAIQGGMLIFNRRAIYTMESGEEKLWGFSTIVINFDKMLESFQLKPEKGDYQFAMKVEAANGHEDFLWGHTEILELDALKQSIVLPGEEWAFAIYPVGGWARGSSTFQSLTYLIYTMLIMVFILSFFYMMHYFRIMDFTKKDTLTGVLNHKSFRNFVDKQLRQGKHLAIVIIDLDRFKEINDTFGHPVGDEVIKETAKRLSGALRATDKLARIGGDEFAIYIDECIDNKVLMQIEERIKTSLSMTMEINHNSINIKFSMGHAISGKDGHSYGELYTSADRKMYLNKGANKLHAIDSKQQL
ncbi:MAG TPA: hypothetical protein DCS67_01810 [Clostridiales bacterium UBA8960]|nr:hypothetical protein [Clostridiales bacterium UBA8960]